MEPSPVTAEHHPTRVQKILSSELLLTALITIMSIFTAVAAYQASLAGGDSLKHFFIAQSELTDASLLYLEQGQEIFYDQSVYDQYQVAILNGDEAAADYYLDQLSTAGREAVARSAHDPFGPTYQTALFAEAIATVADAEAAYDSAVAFNLKGDRLGLVTTILAVGLAFAAWGSLAQAASRQRQLFTLISLGAFLLASIEYLRIVAGGG